MHLVPLVSNCDNKLVSLMSNVNNNLKGSMTTPKPEFPPCSGSSMADAYVLAMWCPVFRRHDSYSGFRTELENLFGDAKERHKRRPREAECTDAPTRLGRP
jgi:hypothetical protein